MQIQASKTVDRLYDEVRGYDLVLTVDAPLSDALNTRLEEPRLGEFATTPRRFVYRREDDGVRDRRDLFIEVVRRTDLSWKQSLYLVENAVDCWQATGELDGILDYPRFDSHATREVVEVLRDTDSVFAAMERQTVGEDLSVAVVGLHGFGALDTKVLPENYDVVTPFAEGTTRLDSFNVFGSATGIVEAVRREVTEENAHDVAVLMDPESRYRPLLESAFESDGVPYMYAEEFGHDENLRRVLGLARAVLTGDRLRVRDVRPFLPSLGMDIGIEHDEKFLNRLDTDGVEPLMRLVEDADSMVFGDLLDRYEEWRGESLDGIRDSLSEVGALGFPLTRDRLDDIEYYLDSFDITDEGSSYGVVFASPLSEAHVDRPVVFYVGMDGSWTREVPDKPWVDEEEHAERALKEFQLLLQNGEDRYFLVRDGSGGDEVTPCFHFHELTHDRIEGFTDFEYAEYSDLVETEATDFEKQEVGTEPSEISTVSQSSMNDLGRSPRQYFFSCVVSEPENRYLERGNLLHDFAEFYVNHPDFVVERGVDEFVELMVERARMYEEDHDLDLRETEFRAAVKNIFEYLRREEVDTDLDGYTKQDERNVFAELYGKPVSSPAAEATFRDTELGIHGKVDLIPDDSRLLDYKTGSVNGTGSIVRATNPNAPDTSDEPDFQPVLYLTHHRAIVRDESLEFTFFELLANVEDRIRGNADVADCLTTVTYHPRTFDEHIARRETYDYLNTANVRQKLLEPLGYDGYRRVFENISVPDGAAFDKDTMVDAVADDLVDDCRGRVEVGRGEDVTEKQLEKACVSVAKKLVDLRTEGFFEEDLDAFEEFVDDKIEEMNRYRMSRFPVGDAGIDGVSERYTDLILEDD